MPVIRETTRPRCINMNGKPFSRKFLLIACSVLSAHCDIQVSGVSWVSMPYIELVHQLHTPEPFEFLHFNCVRSFLHRLSISPLFTCNPSLATSIWLPSLIEACGILHSCLDHSTILTQVKRFPDAMNLLINAAYSVRDQYQYTSTIHNHTFHVRGVWLAYLTEFTSVWSLSHTNPPSLIPSTWFTCPPCCKIIIECISMQETPWLLPAFSQW